MVPLGSSSLAAGIVFTQVGDPLAHGREGGLHCASSDGETGLAFLSEPLSEGEDRAEAVLPVSDVPQGRVVAQVAAEGRPAAEDLVSSPPMLDGVGLGGDRERSAEISDEAVSGSRCSSRHGLSCG